MENYLLLLKYDPVSKVIGQNVQQNATAHITEVLPVAHVLLVFVLLPEIFSLTSFFFSLTFYICCTLYRVVFFLAFILQYSTSKCWHISFKWSVFISHSLFPFSHLPHFALWGEAGCFLEGSIPRHNHTAASILLYFPLRSFSSDLYCLCLDYSTITPRFHSAFWV